ncbi:flap endonuclease GEN [Armigeres subalbatus]|uniref:flap endonuclease GEN n=1 Tax=Armigeres subalbatus TaxID=124917 RepID=UPI002ED4A993
MGIKDLWNLLMPHSEKKPLFHLNGQAVAIDLSGWVCESLNVVDYFVHPRFYLRNLFFRTYYLLQTGIIPVFVLEGSAPPLKYGVIIKRNQMQFRGARPRKTANCDKTGATQKTSAVEPRAPTEQKRNRFHHVLKQCEELLSSMGLVCVQAPGEAEALCAYLNHDGLVYGVISQDSDCFAYGAVRVFRNFCASQTGGGSADFYDMVKIRQVMDVGQEKIVAMGILSGCDYSPAGVPGVGKEMINRFLSNYHSSEILGRIRSWRSTADRLTELEVKVEDKNVCSDCGHRGKTFVHRRSGCQDCRTKSGCDEFRWKNQRSNIKAELDIKRKALQDPDFPPEAIICEFMERRCELPTLDLEWRQPNLVKFIRSIANLLQWDEIYSFLKLYPLFTRWQLLTLKKDPSRSINVRLEPDYIKKKRAPKGVASYEIVWKDEGSVFSGLIPVNQLQLYLNEPGNTKESLWSTIEPQDLVSAVYPELVEAFLASKSKPKKKAKKSPKKKADAKTIKKTKQRRLEDLINIVTGDDDLQQEELEDVLMGEPLDKPPRSDNTQMNQNEHANMSVDSNSDSFYWDLIANGSAWDDEYLDISQVVESVCHPDYGRVKPFPGAKEEEEDRRIEQLLAKARAMKQLLSMSVQPDEPVFDEETDKPNIVQHRLLLKQDLLNEEPDLANQSLLNRSAKPRKRKSFFFESIDVPPPELQDGYNEMDMFECSIALKDQFVMPIPDELNQTIVYDLDF